MDLVIILFFALMTYHFMSRDKEKSRIIQDISEVMVKKEDEVKKGNEVNKALREEISKLKDENRSLSSKILGG